MADSDTTKKLIHEAEDALHKASGAVESTITTTKQSLNKVDQTITEEASVVQSALESVLGGKKRFWVEKPVDGRRLANNMIGWALFGGAVHAWHRGIQKKPIWARPLRPYLIALPVWSLIGYYIHHFELHQEEIIANRRLLLKRNRGLLEDKDIEEMELSQTWKERHEKKLASLNLPADSEGLIKAPKAARPHEDSPMKAKVKDMIAAGDSEMENYGKKLHEKLAQFEKEFEGQAPSKSTGPTQRVSPYLNPSTKFTSFAEMHSSKPADVSNRTPPMETPPSDTKLGYTTPRRFVPQSSEATETPRKSWREYLGLSPPQDLIETSPGSTKISQEELRRRLESGESIESIDAQAGLVARVDEKGRRRQL
ncbi:hypothetical protein CPB86DRAFT_763557 [Serendipita vermifera]|nr:hypothetical protein CPB86DRAFT_763557 [Serendipita vermifera]